MRFFRPLAFVAIVLTASTSIGSAATAAPENDDDKAMFALGMMISRNLGMFDLTAAEVEMVSAGFKAALTGGETHGIDAGAYQQQLQTLAVARQQAKAAAEKEASQSFLTDAAGKPGATQTESGLIYTIVDEGMGANPTAADRVKVHYTGKLRDGTKFDSSEDRGVPAEFALNGVIPCWTEGVQKLKVGGKAKLVCPSDIAYGDQGRPPTIPGGAVLVFDVELLDIVQAPAE